MKKILMQLKNKQGSLLVSSVILASIMISCLMMIVSTHSYQIKFLQLEKDNRLGKILIHKVWKSIEKDIKEQVKVESERVTNTDLIEFSNQVTVFNVGIVNVNSVDNKIYITAKLNNDVTVTQIYVNSYYKNE